MGFHPFHIVSVSPWPFLGSFSILSSMLSFILMVNGKSNFMWISVTSLVMVLICWWRDVIRESTFQGWHTTEVMKGIQIGMILFIVSEVMFFFSFFFSWFFIMLNPDPQVGGIYPSTGIITLNFMKVPFMNTILLISSGISITWSHHLLVLNKSPVNPLILTILIGLIFLLFQYIEYYESFFTISDGVYGSLFYLSTGFHGIHVLMGTLFLTVNLFRMFYKHFSSNHHIGYESSIWYWHFVDVVWLFLFVSIYWWGN